MTDITEITGMKLLQIPSIIIIIIIIVLSLYRMRHESNKLWYGISVLFWMIHSLAFYITVMLYSAHLIQIENQTLIFTNWSSGLRFHGLITYCTLELGRILKWKMAQ